MTKETLTLNPHQAAVVDAFPHRYGFWHSTGSGKTITAIAIANKAKASVLLVVPNMGGILVDKWKKAIDKYADPETSWTIVTKERFRIDFKKIPYHDALIWDEAHALASEKSLMNKAARMWIKVLKPKYIYFLTATPYLSDAPASVLAYGHLLGRDDWKWVDFRYRFYKERYIGRRIIFETRDDIEDELASLMREIGSAFAMEVPHHDILEEFFEPTKEQIALIKKVNESESSPIVRFGKMHQIGQGVLIGNEYVHDQVVPAHKNDRILELVKEHKKVAIFAKYNPQVDLIADLMAANDIPFGVINGESKDKTATSELLERSPRAVAIINSACAVGYELPSFTAIVYASCSWSLINHEQSLGRFDRINKAPIKRAIYYLMTRDILDADILDSLKNKKDFDIALYSRSLPQKSSLHEIPTDISVEYPQERG